MAVYKDAKRNTWYVSFRYSDSFGNRKRKLKRGFRTKTEANRWELEEITKLNYDLNMKFSKLVELYEHDTRHRIKESTWETKKVIIDKKILPYFGDLEVSKIDARTVRHWQKIIMEKEDENGKKYAESYLATIHSQLSAIFNHAIKFYGLKTNPAYQAGGMGNKGNKEMDFWTQEEYKKFIETMMNQPYYFYGFEILYWCGLRIGELLALTPADFDFEKKIVSINKSYQRINKKDVITEPKTIKSIRTIIMPDFLSDEIEDFIEMHYGIQPNQRIFPLTKRHFELQIKNGSKAAGVKTIRVHDLRHSHVSLSQGYF